MLPELSTAEEKFSGSAEFSGVGLARSDELPASGTGSLKWKDNQGGGETQRASDQRFPRSRS